jgi:hypothetical protein
VNSLKNILVVTVLLGVGYAVYTTINSQPGSSPPPEQADGWPTSVDIQMLGGSDSKTGTTKNPFAARGNDSAERVPARDANPFGSPGAASDRFAQTRSAPGSAPRSAQPGSPSPDSPGEATSTDIPPYASSSPPSATPPRA